MKHLKRLLLIYHVFVAVGYLFQGNFMVPLFRVPLILFLTGTYVNKVTKYYTVVMGFLVMGVALAVESPGMWELFDFLSGVGTAYYGFTYSLDKRVSKSYK